MELSNVFASLDESRLGQYHRYWESLAVASNADYFRRWLFAFCSVHTTWERNVVGYQAIRDFTEWLGDDSALRARLVESGCGLYNIRTKFISEFAEDFWSNPNKFWKPRTVLSWRDFRDTLEANILGLGLAKTSFALELAFPVEAKLACLDVHMLRLYGINPERVKPADYRRAELDWVERSLVAGAEPYVARMVYWDGLQGKDDSRYWSHCLEKT